MDSTTENKDEKKKRNWKMAVRYGVEEGKEKDKNENENDDDDDAGHCMAAFYGKRRMRGG